MRLTRKFLSVSVAISLLTFGIVLPAKAATSLGTETTNSYATSVSQTTTVNTELGGTSKVALSGFAGTVRVIVTATGGTVKLNTTTGLSTITGYQNPVGTAAASIGFTATASAANTALDDLRYIAGAAGGTFSIQIDASSAGTGSIAYNASNGHYYQYVTDLVTWNAANTAIGACNYNWNGMCGYFANVTTSDENAYITSKVGTAAAWLGGTDSALEGDWKWVGGPASETKVFWHGTSSGTPQNSLYANWNTGEPNDSGSNEDALQIIAGGSGQWNDLPTNSSTMGYVVEYGGLGETISESSVQRTLSVLVRANQSALTVSSTTGNYLQPLTLTTSGGSGTGAVTYVLDAGGTATGCSLTDGVLAATSLGTCLITATKAQDGDYLAKSSSSTAVSFKTYLGDTTTNSATVGYNGNIILNTELGATSKISGKGFTGNVRAEVVATGGNVQITTTTGVTKVTGYQNPVGAAAASIAFEGAIADVNTALDSLTYTATASPSSKSVVVTISPISTSSIAYNTDNGHYYQYVSTPVTWNAASAAITANADGVYTFNGMTGYFANVTSAAENTFIMSKVGTAQAWLGGSDSAVEGTWRWIAGPENGNLISAAYSNWNTSEPNDFGTGEDALQILAGGSGKWNDLPNNSTTMGYVVEYGGVNTETETLTAASRTVDITITTTAQSTLVVSPVDATFNTPFTLATTGGSGTGAVTYTVTDGTATGCAIAAGALSSTTSGTCLVTATKAADTNYLVKTSAATAVTFWESTISTPAAPTVTSGNGSATISWTAVPNTSSYTVTSNPGGLTCTSTETSCTITGLTNGVSYTFTIVATNPIGVTSTVSTASSSVTPREPRTYNPNPVVPPTENKPTIPGEPTKQSVGPNGETNTPPAPATEFVPTSSKPTDQNIQLIENGEIKSVTITPVIPDGVVTIEGAGWNLNLSVNDGGQQIAPVNTAGNIVFTRGNDSSFAGGGFMPSSIFRVFILSTPIFLGEFKADIFGEISGQVKIPDSLSVGLHTLQFNNIANNSDNRVISVGVQVVKKATYKKPGSAKKRAVKKIAPTTGKVFTRSGFPFKKIYCTNGTETIKVVARNPVCPKGYKY